MSANLPLDANDEDILRRGFVRPSLGDNPLPLGTDFQAVRSQYDNFVEGVTNIDNIWPLRTARELSNLSPAQVRETLQSRGVIPPEGTIPFDQPAATVTETLSSINSQIDNVLGQGNPLDAFGGAGANITSAAGTDSYGQSLNGPTTQPTPLTTPPPGGRPTPVGTVPGPSTAYGYTPMDMYDDRYDFLTGKIVRKGLASGTKGGLGAEEGSTLGAAGVTQQQSEGRGMPSNVGANDTSSDTTYDDAILRQARAEGGGDPDANDPRNGQYSSPTVNNATTAEIARQPDQTVDYTDNTEADTGNWTPPPRTETSPPRPPQASREQIRESRRQSSRDISDARARGVALERRRNPDGTYYTAPSTGARDVTNAKNLPQRVRDF